MSSIEEKEKLVKILDSSLKKMALGDIEKAAIKGEAKMAGFILGSCFIDILAGFYSGIDKKSSKKGNGKRYKKFVKKYLKQYDATKLYEDLRCMLVHNYFEGGSYLFTDATNQNERHFEKYKGKIILNLEDFYNDLEKAYSDFKEDILKNDAIFHKAKKRLKSLGLLTIITKK